MPRDASCGALHFADATIPQWSGARMRRGDHGRQAARGDRSWRTPRRSGSEPRNRAAQPPCRIHTARRRSRGDRASYRRRLKYPALQRNARTTIACFKFRAAMNALPQTVPLDIPDPLMIAGRAYRSRLLTGTGKYKDLDETRRATEAAGSEIITFAVRRMNLGQEPGEPNLLDALPPECYTLLPNTAGCHTADECLRTCRLARELLDGHSLVKLETIGDQKTLFPDIIETLAAAEMLVKDGFDVMVYTTDDPLL